MEFKKVNNFAGGTYKAENETFTIYWYPSTDQLVINTRGDKHKSITIKISDILEISKKN